MTPVCIFEQDEWSADIDADRQEAALATLENGGILVFPRLPFAFLDVEQPLFDRVVVGRRSKNVSYEVATGKIRGVPRALRDEPALLSLMRRYTEQSNALVHRLFPSYVRALIPGRISFRPGDVAVRKLSWRKDDSRMHIDAFPSRPTCGHRLLRVFSNISPAGQARVWRVGEPFAAVARRFLPMLGRPIPGSAAILHLLGVTQDRRSEYDHLMLQLHDRMKGDARYQASCPSTEMSFAAGTTWITTTDLVSHAAMSGKYMMESTLLLPVAAMRTPERAPLRVLEHLMGRTLV